MDNLELIGKISYSDWIRGNQIGQYDITYRIYLNGVEYSNFKFWVGEFAKPCKVTLPSGGKIISTDKIFELYRKIMTAEEQIAFWNKELLEIYKQTEERKRMIDEWLAMKREYIEGKIAELQPITENK